jgi:hypothetical protein
MEAAEILSTARSGSAPSNWVILPLRRNQVALAMAGWVLGTVMGLGLFIALFLATWPDNFERGTVGIIITSFFLAILAFTGVGSLWALLVDGLRLLRADQSIIVITPDTYCKQDGNKITLVPLEEIGYVTTTGVRSPNKQSSWAMHRPASAPNYDPEDRQVSATGVVGRFFGFRRKPHGPISVAFVDMRTNKKVVVTSDHSYAHPYELGETLSWYVEAYRRNTERAESKGSEALNSQEPRGASVEDAGRAGQQAGRSSQ